MTKAFIDSSVFIAAVRSPTGGSAEVLRYAITEHFEAVISGDVVEEVMRYFSGKMPRLVPAMELVFRIVPFHFANPTMENVIAAGLFTPDKDKAIVAGAMVGEVDFLVTLDKKHLLDKRAEIEASVAFKVARPEDFLAVLRHRN